MYAFLTGIGVYCLFRTIFGRTHSRTPGAYCLRFFNVGPGLIRKIHCGEFDYISRDIILGPRLRDESQNARDRIKSTIAFTNQLTNYFNVFERRALSFPLCPSPPPPTEMYFADYIFYNPRKTLKIIFAFHPVHVTFVMTVILFA